MMHRTLHSAVVATLVAWGAWTLQAADTFEELRVGSTVYTNVKVGGTNSTDVYIRHNGGFANLKVNDLSPEVQVLLGYDVEPTPVANRGLDLTSLQENPRIQAIEKQLIQRMEGSVLKMDQTLLASLLLAGLVVYMFFCYCSMLICKNAGTEPGLLVWIPILQLFPMLRAAGMSGWWFLAFALPFVNIVASVVWCLRIAEACGKSALVGVLLMLPIVGLLPFLYLAFSGVCEEDGKLQPIKLNLRST